MGKQMVSELRVGEPVDAVFLVAEVQLRTARTGSNYLHLSLQDRSGRIVGRLWDATEAFAASIAVDDWIQVKGKVESYQGQLQINIRSITKPQVESLNLSDFLPQSERDPNEMLRELAGLLGKVQDPDYCRLIKAFLADKEFCEAFRRAPAAKENHHSYLGGLLEHTLSMAHVAERLLDHYTHLRRDLLLTGVFLHDIGKTQELTYKRTFQYSTPGNLVGHIMLGVLMLEDRARTISNFPQDKLNMLRHMILSHHGALEFGSPKQPMFAEAMALHYIDNLDAKLKDFKDLVAEDHSPDPDWTEYSTRLARRLYKG